MEYISIIAMPAIIITIIGYGLIKKEKVFDTFMIGAKEGIEVSIRIIPSIVGIMVAIGVFKSSGAMEYLEKVISPVTNLINIPKEVVPIALMRPISGSASIGILSQALSEYGADSVVGRIASTIMGCTETTFYTIAVYFGAVGVKNTKYVIPVAVIADIVAIIIACNIIV